MSGETSTVVVLFVRVQVVVLVGARILSEVWINSGRGVCGKMVDGKVKKDRYLYCRFCGAWCRSGEVLKHRESCVRSYVGEIDHKPEAMWWCCWCQGYFKEGKKPDICPKCGEDGLYRRYH